MDSSPSQSGLVVGLGPGIQPSMTLRSTKTQMASSPSQSGLAVSLGPVNKLSTSLRSPKQREIIYRVCYFTKVGVANAELTKIGLLSPGKYTSTNPKCGYIEEFHSLVIKGIRESAQWRKEVTKNNGFTETVQLFMPAEPNQDAQVLLTVSNNRAWEMLQVLRILETP